MRVNEEQSALPEGLAPLPDGWEYQTLEKLTDESRGICYGIVQPGSHSGEGVPIIRVNNIKHGRINTTDVLRVSSDIEENYRRSRLRGGEVLLTLVGSLGQSAVVPKELAAWNVARAVGVIPVKPMIGSRWVEICLRSPNIQHYIRTGWVSLLFVDSTKRPGVRNTTNIGGLKIAEAAPFGTTSLLLQHMVDELRQRKPKRLRFANVINLGTCAV